MTEKEKDKIRLGKISVKMGDKEVNLTVEQARELCALLKGLFGDDSTKIVHVHDYWYYRPWYMGPNWTYTGSNWGVAVDPPVPPSVYTSDGTTGSATVTFNMLTW